VVLNGSLRCLPTAYSLPASRDDFGASRFKGNCTKSRRFYLFAKWVTYSRMSPSGPTPDLLFSARMSPSASCGHAAQLLLVSKVPILLQKSPQIICRIKTRNNRIAPKCIFESTLRIGA
jgi:hypothetical protein